MTRQRGLVDGTTIQDYRNAMSGEGPLAAQWIDKPHRLIWDLCGEVELLQDIVDELSKGIDRTDPQN